MRETLLVIMLALVFGLGYVLMKKLDWFLVDNRKAMEKETEEVEPSRIMLTNALSDEEIMDEIRRFRVKHENVTILVCEDIDGIQES